MEDPYSQTEETEASREFSRKRPHEEEKEAGDNSKDVENKRSSNHNVVPLLKLLVPNYAAGAIIGKGGSNIADLQKRYGGKIRLSPGREHYPGTEERICVITGEVSQIIDLNDYVIDKVNTDPNFKVPDNHDRPKRARDEARSQQVKIILTNATAGLVIGRNGATIKALQEETKAKIMISSRDDSKVFGERILTISGNTEQRVEASRQVINKISVDPEYASNKNLTYGTRNNYNNQDQPDDRRNNFRGGMDNFSGRDSNGGAFPTLDNIFGNLQQQSQKESILSNLANNALQQLGIGNGPGNPGHLGSGVGNAHMAQVAQQLGLAQQTNQAAQNNVKTTIQIQMEIPEILIAPIMGPQGKYIQEFIQFSGAKITLAQKSDFNSTRALTIYGDLSQTQVAYYLVNEKIKQAGQEISNVLNGH